MIDHKDAVIILPTLPPRVVWRPRLQQELFPAGLIESGIAPCIPSAETAQPKYPRQGVIPPATSHRKQLRPSKKLTLRVHPLSLLRGHLLLSHLHRSYRHLLRSNLMSRVRGQ